MSEQFNLSEMLRVLSGKVKVDPIFKSAGNKLDSIVFCLFQMQKEIEDLRYLLSKKVVFQQKAGDKLI